VRFQHLLRLLVVEHGVHDRACPALGILRFEDPGTDEHRFGTELHEERCIGRCRDSAGCEVGNRKLAVLVHPTHELYGRSQLLGFVNELLRVEHPQPAHLRVDRAQVPHCLHHVTGARFTLRTDQRGALGDATQRLTQVAAAADEGHAKRPLVDVVGLVGGCEDLALVDEVDLQCLENLGLREVADSDLRHDRNRHDVHDLTDLVGRSHPCHASLGADV
jgi:hypothetical protein